MPEMRGMIFLLFFQPYLIALKKNVSFNNVTQFLDTRGRFVVGISNGQMKGAL